MSTLLDRARSAGLAVWSSDGRLALEGPETAAPIAKALLDAEAEVLAELDAERARREPQAPLRILPAGADPARPPRGWHHVERGPLAGCWIGPDGALATAGRAEDKIANQRTER